MRIADGELLHIDGITPYTIHTPGHTDDSYSFVMADRVFTGDTLAYGASCCGFPTNPDGRPRRDE